MLLCRERYMPWALEAALVVQEAKNLYRCPFFNQPLNSRASAARTAVEDGKKGVEAVVRATWKNEARSVLARDLILER